MIRKTANRLFLATAVAAGVVTAALFLASPGIAQLQLPQQDQERQDQERQDGEAPARKPQRPQGALKVGTYDPQRAFDAHPVQEELTEALQEARVQLQKAQQEEDQQKMQQAQQKYQQAHQRAVQRFQQDASEALPEVAKAAGVKIVAVEIVYQADDVKTVDLTPRLVRAFDKEDNGEDRDAPTRPAIPQMPQN